MKNILKKIILICFVLICTTAIKAQSTCGTVVTYTYPVTQTVTSYSNSEYWFKITTPGAGLYQLQISNGSGTGKISAANVYTGSCGTLTFYTEDSVYNSSQTTFLVEFESTGATTYYIDLVNTPATAITFSITTIRQVKIGGQLSYLSGGNDTLKALPVGPSGTQSYTWNPGGLHTAQIVVTPTVNTTYTLTYSDALGTLIDTATAKPFSSSTCQLVPNGNLEALQGMANGASNIPTAGGCFFNPNLYPSPSSTPDWTSPTCATPDYFNSAYNTPNNGVGVPTNQNASNTPAHSGTGYAGIYTLCGNWREYIQSALNCPLVSGLSYNISYWVSLSTLGCTTPANNIGAYLSTSAPTHTITGTLASYSYTPQINTYTPINNPGSWTQVSGTVVGGGEQYITIGNFFTNANTNPSSGCSYYFIDDISVTPVTPTVTAGSCQSGSVTITAYGAPNTTLTTWAGPSSYTATGSSITVASPTAAVTYTCTLNLSAGCGSCSNVTQTITINPATTCTGTPCSTPTVTSTFTASPGYAASSITVGPGINWTIKCTDLRMAATTSISVASGGTLTIQGSWIHACNQCNSTSMWQGIVVQNGGTLKIQYGTDRFDNPTYSIIEDAVQAVYTATNATTTPIPTWSISDVIFNNNSTDMYIDAHEGDLSGNAIYNSVFTCRNLKSHAITSTNFLGIRSDIRHSTPLLHSTTNPTDLTIAGARTTYGIRAKSVSVNANHPIKVGSGSQAQNIFDNLDYGIYATDADIDSRNCRFQNITGDHFNVLPLGIGIYVSETDKRIQLIAGNSNLTINNTERDTFVNCLIGIATNKLTEVHINNNYFNNETTASTFTTSGSYVTGEYGVAQTKYASNASAGVPEQMQYSSNSCSNYATGHYLDFAKLNNTASAATTFTNNVITGSGSSTQYCSTGIYLQQATPATNTVVPKDGLSVTSNTITNVNTNAISVSNVNTSASTTGFLQIYNNGELSVKFNSALASLQSPRVAAINLSNAHRTRVTYNGNVRVTGYSSAPAVQYQAGIYTTTSQSCTINCNTVTCTGEDFVFEGNCATANNCWQNNVMDYSMYGLVLRTSGILGDQGGSTYPINDNWSASADFTSQTLTDATNPGTGTTSKLYTQTVSCTYKPCTNTVVPSTGAIAYTSGTTLLTGTGSNTLTCGAAGTGDRIAGNSNQSANDEANADSSFYQNIQNTLNNDPTPYPVYDAETRWGLQYMVSGRRPDLAAATGYENAKAFALADEQIAEGNYAQAQNSINAITPVNVIETNWKTVDDILIRIQSDTLNSNDVNTLQSVAIQCPHSGGSIVWTARAQLNSYYGQIFTYPNDCPVNSGGERMQNAANNIRHEENKYRINLYPNPNNGQMQIDYNIVDNVDLQILDINGNLVCLYNLKADANTINITNDKLGNGVYFYRMVKNNVPYKCQKLVIIK